MVSIFDENNDIEQENLLLGKVTAFIMGCMSLAIDDIYVEVSRNAYMKLDEIKKLNHPILDLNDVFCVQGD